MQEGWKAERFHSPKNKEVLKLGRKKVKGKIVCTKGSKRTIVKGKIVCKGGRR